MLPPYWVPVAADFPTDLWYAVVSRSLFALVGLFLYELVSFCIGNIGRSLFTLVGLCVRVCACVCVCLHTCIRVCTNVPMDSAGQSRAQFIGGLHAR